MHHAPSANRSLLLLGVLVALGGLLSGCIVDDHHGFSSCREECYEVCDVWCDAWGCWEDCWLECVCYEEQVVTQECVSSRDCYSDEVCVDGSCERDTSRGDAGLCEPCRGHDDCLEQGALCVVLSNAQSEQVCGRACTSDAGCPSGFTCVELTDADGSQCIPSTNTCSDMTVGCASNTDCRAGEACEAGSCVPDMTGPQCRADADCPADQICVDAACVEPEPQCETDTDCADGQVCDVATGTCAAPPACADDSACASGEVCRDGSCLAIECQRNDECPAGALCVNAECREPCATNAECATAEICVDGYCSSSVQCHFSVDCAEGQVCVNATCEQGCAASTDCAEGQVCRLGYCAPGSGM